MTLSRKYSSCYLEVQSIILTFLIEIDGDKVLLQIRQSCGH